MFYLNHVCHTCLTELELKFIGLNLLSFSTKKTPRNHFCDNFKKYFETHINSLEVPHLPVNPGSTLSLTKIIHAKVVFFLITSLTSHSPLILAKPHLLEQIFKSNSGNQEL